MNAKGTKFLAWAKPKKGSSTSFFYPLLSFNFGIKL
jgi:hypothetical protein